MGNNNKYGDVPVFVLLIGEEGEVIYEKENENEVKVEVEDESDHDEDDENSSSNESYDSSSGADTEINYSDPGYCTDKEKIHW